MNDPSHGLDVPGAVSAEVPRLQPLASYLHTAIVVALMVGVGVMSAASFKAGKAPTTPLALYIPTIIWLWSLALIVYLGMRRRGSRIVDAFGRPWRSFDDVLTDFVVAGGFWLGVLVVLVLLSLALFRLSHTPTPTTIPTEMRALAPSGPLAAILWLVLSVTAGVCEEFVFRGYLQKQFAALSNNVAAGIVLSALVFSIGHLYEGAVRATVIGVFGVMLGMLAHYRRSLAPGMIAHAWHDIFSGALLAFASKLTH